MVDERRDKEEFAPRQVENAVSADEIAKIRAEKLAKLQAADQNDETDNADEDN